VSTKTVAVPRQMWYESGELQLEFPESWDVVPCLMDGHNAPHMTPEQIRAAFSKPIGTPAPSGSWPRGKKEVAC